MTDPSAPGPSKADAVARAAALVEREDAEAHAAIGKSVRARRGRELALVVMLAANLLAWVVFPPRGADTADPRTPEEVERDLRLTVGGVAEDLEAWREANGGALPTSLDVLAEADSSVAYAKLDSALFELRGTAANVTVTYRSGTPVAEFIAGTGERKP
jgi:hypothetical protein